MPRTCRDKDGKTYIEPCTYKDSYGNYYEDKLSVSERMFRKPDSTERGLMDLWKWFIILAILGAVGLSAYSFIADNPEIGVFLAAVAVIVISLRRRKKSKKTPNHVTKNKGKNIRNIALVIIGIIALFYFFL